MDRLPHCLLLQILSRLDDSADVARCRVASKGFNTVFPGLRSINLRCSYRYFKSDLPQRKTKKIKTNKYSNSWRVSNSQRVKPFKTVFLDLISKLETVESVCISYKHQLFCDPKLITDVDFVKEWLPRVSESLKSLSLAGHYYYHKQLQTGVLPVISAYCHNLVNLKLGYYAWRSVENLNPMAMLTSLTLSFTSLKDEQANELHKWFPNLQFLKLVDVAGLRDPKIRLLNLKTCIWVMDTLPTFFSLNTPNLTTLRIVCRTRASARPRVETPMLHELERYHEGAFILKKCKKIKTLSLECSYLGSLLSKFPITKTVENLTLDSRNEARYIDDLELTLGKVFTAFPKVTYLCIESGLWSKLEASSNVEGWEILRGRKGLKTIRAYLMLVNPSLTFLSVACLFDQCVHLSDVSLLIHDDVVGTVSKDFMSKCMARWPRLKWRWGVWSEYFEDSWITNAISNSTPVESSKKRHL